MPARKRGRPRKYGKRATTRKTSPLANLAKKVTGIDHRLHSVESEVVGLPKRYIRRKRKPHRLAALESSGSHYWASGE